MAEQNLSKLKAKNILQGSSIAHFVINKDHVIVEWNRACEVPFYDDVIFIDHKMSN